MGKYHDQLKKQVLEALQVLFGDTSVPQEVTRSSLEEISEELSILIETLRNSE